MACRCSSWWLHQTLHPDQPDRPGRRAKRSRMGAMLAQLGLQENEMDETVKLETVMMLAVVM